MDLFETYHLINDNITAGNENVARNDLIKVLDYHHKNDLEYSPLLNHLIRSTGLYPYIQPESATWQDQWIYELFRVDIGGNKEATLHREQSLLLKKLLSGQSIAVSAPTSFGKSFVIDAFISIKRPSIVVIIVPTLALTDETRRRIQKKFGKDYKIITTSEVEQGSKSIYIFPQERANTYINKLEKIDILIIDEFYKASIDFDRERAPILLKSIIELGKIATQKYFLAPNISKLSSNPFTEGMEFVALDFNTVYTEKYELYKQIEKGDVEKKVSFLFSILENKISKTLVYAGTFTNIDYIANELAGRYENINSRLLNDFSDWLARNYHPSYILTDLVKKGIGIHNGKIHRSLSQIQVRLFEEEGGINTLISTSSIIEGVNTSAENVVIWANKNGRPPLNDFTYRNIVGRGGRMFKHFIGKVYLLAEPPLSEATQLSLPLTDDLLNSLDEEKHKEDLTREQIIKIIAFKDEMNSILGDNAYNDMVEQNLLQSFNHDKIKTIAYDMLKSPSDWYGLGYLNSTKPEDWEASLFKTLPYAGGVGAAYKDVVAFIKAISSSWTKPIYEIVENLRSNGVTFEKFFELERSVTFKLATMLSDINNLQKRILVTRNIDISVFISKLSNAFLPPLVYSLEEYGLPRMISRKIHDSHVINLENNDLTIHQVINIFVRIGYKRLVSYVKDLDSFDLYILSFFYEGITNE